MVAEDQQSTKRGFVVSEVLSTEQTYVDDLELIICDYKQPAENAPLGLADGFWSTVFSNIEDIHYAAHSLLQELEACSFFFFFYISLLHSVSSDVDTSCVYLSNPKTFLNHISQNRIFSTNPFVWSLYLLLKQ